MFQRLIQCVRDFLALRLIPGRRLLLALSGGGDSLALLYLLLKCRHYLDFDLHIAHVDHGHRSESRNEAEILRRLAKHLNLHFHQRRLDPLTHVNLEERYREMRYQFFHELQEKFKFQALLLAHHRDDQGETLLKRICEGAGIKALGGMLPEVRRGNLILWRPLLSSRKEELSAYLEENQITPFDDWTNRDITYLRSRMRLKIFPDLESHFGKKIGGNFSRLGNVFQEIAIYLEEKRKKIETHLVSGPFGEYLENPFSFPRLEMRFFLEEKARSAKAHFSQDSCEILLNLIEILASKATVHAESLDFVLNKRYLFILKNTFPIYDFKEWKVKEGLFDWKDFWKGTVPSFPKGCQPVHLNGLEPLMRRKIKKWYEKHRVPPFFHNKAPVFVFKGKIVGECLTGKGVNI